MLFVTGEYPPMRGGVGDYTARLVEALDACGWRASVLTTRRVVTDDPRVLPAVGRWDWSILCWLPHLIRSSGAAIVHIQYQTGAFQMHPVLSLLPRAITDRGRGPRVVTTFHDLLPPYLFPKAGPLRDRVTRCLATGSDAVVATNDADFERLRSGWCPDPDHRLSLIPIGSNLPDPVEIDRAAVRARLGIDPGEAAVGFFGFLGEDKGLDTLLDALDRAETPRLRLVLIGGGLPETDVANAGFQQWVEERLRRLRVPVTRAGHLTPGEAAEALAAVDLVVLPFRDGASLRRGSLIAAIRAGAPVLTTAPESPETILPFEGGESVWLVPAGNVEALRQSMDILLTHPLLRHRLAEAALKVAAPFDWQLIARRHSELYTRLLAA